MEMDGKISNDEALDQIARYLHNESLEIMSDFQKKVAFIISKTNHGRIERSWNWSHTKQCDYFIWEGSV